MFKTNLAFASILATLSVAACSGPEGQSADGTLTEDAVKARGASYIHLYPERCDKPGTFVALGEIAAPSQVALDAYCAEVVLAREAPRGSVVIFGSSRLKDGTAEYASVREFAKTWTTDMPQFPILTGGGGGLMEGGNRGAKEAGGKSLGFSTYFRDAKDTLNAYTTGGYMFSDFETRERAMLRYAAAVVIYPGGVGTGWEFFMTLSNLQTKKMKKIPMILVGADVQAAIMPYLTYMSTKGTISPDDINLFKPVATAKEAITELKLQLPAAP